MSRITFNEISHSAPSAIGATEPWPSAGLRRVTECPVCGHTSHTGLHHLVPDLLFGAPGLWSYVTCNNCTAAFLDPQPTQDTIARAYEHYFTHRVESSDSLQRGLRWILRAFANGCRNEHFGTHYSPAAHGFYWIAKRSRAARAIMDGESRYLDMPRGGATLLDVGCGNGAFLDLANQLGWSVEGIDFDHSAAAAARSLGHVVHSGELESLPSCYTGHFDAVTLSHVLEHVHDPIALLRQCFRLLKKGGTLYVETPNKSSLGHARYGPAWRGLEPPRHLVLFTPHSLTLALGVAGFGKYVDQPWRPLCWHMFLASEKLKAKMAGSTSLFAILRSLWNSVNAETQAARTPALREYITRLAYKL